MENPFKDNPLRTKADIQKAVLDLWSPLKPYYSTGRARVKFGQSGFIYPNNAAELEGFSRPLWGLVPLAAGGGQFADWEFYRQGLSNGTNLQHPEYWGEPRNRGQELVEMAALGLALAMAGEQVWQPLDEQARLNLGNWLRQINHVEIVDSNWLFFRVLVNLGLQKVGAAYDQTAMQQALDRLEEFYLSRGWYSDGPVPQVDYYIPFAFHFYGLLYAKLAADTDPARASRFREKAEQFAQEFVHWFIPDGAALPFGRSLTYRFAQGSFWGALAFADIEALPWGVIKGLALRHLRWWAKQPIFNPDGTLSIGYTYPNLNMAEQYNAPGSPYWALKFFLPLALPETHPFWQAEELPLPDLPDVQPQPEPGMLLCRDAKRNHLFALSGKQYHNWARHGEAKYAKFAYSSAFGFSVPGAGYGLEVVGYDSMLALSEDNRHYRVREEVTQTKLEGEALYSRWQPWSDVEIETWLVPALPWHLRIHRIRTARTLYCAESGFAAALPGEINSGSLQDSYTEQGSALVAYRTGWSGLKELSSALKRVGQVHFPHPNTNLLASRTAMPVLFGKIQPGEHRLACAVLGLPGSEQDYKTIWNTPPRLELEENGQFSVSL